MKDIDICTGMYASQWCLTDFYEKSEQKLREAIASGEEFDTGWWGCKKEIHYARIMRDDEDVTVEVSCHMDDLFDGNDLIYDALWEECGTEEELPDDIIDSIRIDAIESGIEDESNESETLPRDASFEDIVKCIDRLEDEAENTNTDMYKTLCNIVKGYVEQMKGESAK
jgi:hypothetical protein